MEMFACDLGHLSASQVTGLFLWKLSSTGMQSAVCLLRVSMAANDLRQHLTHPYLQKPVKTQHYYFVVVLLKLISSCQAITPFAA